MRNYKGPSSFLVYLCLGVLLVQTCQAVYNPIAFNLSLTDVSPIFKWGFGALEPEASVGPHSWAVSFSNSSNASLSSSDPDARVGYGVSGHRARAVPAGPFVFWPRIYFSVETTAVYIHGSRDPEDTGSAGDITYLIDGGGEISGAAPRAGELLAVEGLPFGMRSFEIKIADVSRMYTVRGATAVSQLMSNASSWDFVPVSYESFVQDSAPNPRFTYVNSSHSQWHTETRNLGVDGGPSSVSELVAGDAARVTIPVPPGTAFLLLNGTVGSDRGEALITWKPAPPNFPLKGWSFNMSSLWNAPALLYATQLDPDVVYNVTIEALSNEMYNVTDIGLHTLTYYSGWSQEPVMVPEGKRSSAGAIAGGVIGGVLGVLLLAALISFILHRRRRAKAKTVDAEHEQRSNGGFAPVPFMQEVDGGSIHSATDSVHQHLPPSYNPQWSSRVNSGGSPALTPSVSQPASSPQGLLGTLAIGRSDKGSPFASPPLSPGLVSPVGGREEILGGPDGQRKEGGGQTGAISASSPLPDYKRPYVTGDYKAPYIAGQFERLDSSEQPTLGRGAEDGDEGMTSERTMTTITTNMADISNQEPRTTEANTLRSAALQPVPAQALSAPNSPSTILPTRARPPAS